MNLAPKRILIAGGAGFLWLAPNRSIDACGDEVRCSDNLLTCDKCDFDHRAGEPCSEFPRHDIACLVCIEIDAIDNRCYRASH